MEFEWCGPDTPSAAVVPSGKEAAVLPLPGRLGLSQAETLVQELQARSGADLVLDVSAVRSLSTPCVQILLAAAKSWRNAGHELRLTAPQQEFLTTLALLAVDPDEIQTGGGAS